MLNEATHEGALKLEPHQIVFRPLLTEKVTDATTAHNQFAFEVNPRASKLDIKHAIEVLFEVKVLKVRTQNRKGKARRYKFRNGMTKDWKRALITLGPEDKLEFF